jgi:uncharacterized protein (TIGR02118 family)
MITVSVLYPNTEGSTLDMDYYLAHHIPLVREIFGGSLKGLAVEQGIGGGAPGSPAPYKVMGRLTFDTIDDFAGAIGPRMQDLSDDIPKFTNVQPLIQISELIA